MCSCDHLWKLVANMRPVGRMSLEPCDNKSSRGSTSKSQKLNKVWANPKDLSLCAFLKRGEKVPKLGLQSR